MNRIKSLLLKDMLELKTYKKSFIFILFFYCFFIFFQGKETDSVYIGTIMIMIISSMIPLSTFGYDERTNTSRYLNTLPISRKEMVLEKYILLFICVVLGSLLGGLLSSILTYLSSGNTPDINSLLSYIMGGIIGISLMDSIQIMTIYKYGVEKGRVMMYIMTFVLIGIVSMLSYVLPKDIPLPKVDNLPVITFLIFIIILFIIYYISYKISYSIYKKKDA